MKSRSYLRKNVVILVIDGPRMDDTWNSAKLNTVPNQKELLREGVFFNGFYNNGITKPFQAMLRFVLGRMRTLLIMDERNQPYHLFFSSF
ncbi:hypothetical protein OAD50_05210 [Vicingaceae bacterium]|nr:hypothetical protein [Vicingaceae bacterium]